MSEYGLIWTISASPSGKPCAVRGKTLIQPRVGPVAQWLEPAAHNRLVGGSSPSGPTITIDFIGKKWPRPKTFWANYGPKAKTVVPVCSDSFDYLTMRRFARRFMASRLASRSLMARAISTAMRFLLASRTYSSVTVIEEWPIASMMALAWMLHSAR